MDRNRNPERAADDQQQAALPLNIPAQRPQIGGLHADAARHHQRHRFQRLENPKQDGARDRGKGEAGQARDEGPGEHGNAQQNICRQIRHGFRSLGLWRFPAKHALGLDPGWKPVRAGKTRQNKREPGSDSIKTDEALVVRQRRLWRARLRRARRAIVLHRTDWARMRAVEHDAAGDVKDQRKNGCDGERRQAERGCLRRTDPGQSGLRRCGGSDRRCGRTSYFRGHFGSSLLSVGSRVRCWASPPGNAVRSNGRSGEARAGLRCAATREVLRGYERKHSCASLADELPLGYRASLITPRVG